jgi:hypothetical protein
MAYSGSRVLLITLITGLVVALVIGLMIASAGGVGNAPFAIAIAIIAIGLVVGVLLFVAHRRQQSQRTQARQEALERLPDGCVLSPVESPDPKLHQAFGPLPRIPRGGRVQLVLRGELDGRELTCFQHLYVVSTGQTTVPVQNTAIVTEAPQWPTVTIRPRGALNAMLLRFGLARGMRLEDDSFNRAFKVSADNEDFALTLIPPEMQRFLIEKPTLVWRVNPGHVAMIYRGQLRFDRLDGSIERMRTFWSLVPPELTAW